ncbi:hypothetical protein ACQJBY_062469 [Aegilops geniculata]|uniref:Uncharacterized protein n=1 Tax=Triticum turgidum subsp. durum TaxID=4567 RepID=A0A9R0YGA8_TRITD|nr:unnamed protein product [Triticum turgidum subsp. durum]VAI69493.1 unnamed protein product [Triticum turgidum subsp. durum]
MLALVLTVDACCLQSVAFSAAPAFAAAAVWLVGFALAALVACCCRCCRGSPTRDDDYSYSRKTFAASLLLLLAFTATAM